MILSFKTKWPKEMGDLAGKPTFFVDQIHQGLLNYGLLSTYTHYRFLRDYHDLYKQNIGHHPAKNSKIHSLREDKGDRWLPGVLIDFFINARQKDMYRFAPRLPVISTQTVFMHYFIKSDQLRICMDGRWIPAPEIEELSINDGFDNVIDFRNFFIQQIDPTGNPLKLKLIHWTSFKY